MLRKNRFLFFLLSGFTILSLLAPATSFARDEIRGGHHSARNIIFMVPDGMGLSNVTAARIFKSGPDGDPLFWRRFPRSATKEPMPETAR